jgi:hypothetical protein
MNTRKKIAASANPKYSPLVTAAREQLVQAVESLIDTFKPVKKQVHTKNKKSVDEAAMARDYRRLCDAAATLHRWHSDSKYLTSTGATKKLPRVGNISLENLTYETLGNKERANQAAMDLIEFCMVTESSGQYTPANRSAVIKNNSPLILAHATSAVSRLIKTVTHNVSGKRPSRYERQLAEVEISTQELPQFLRFVEQQGEYFIDAIDDWLAARESNKAPVKKAVRVGVGAFAWAEEEETIKKRKPSPSIGPRR